jgi:CheY-like chemotaxis protein
MKRILIVEDDARVAKALEVRIRSAGYATALAGDCSSGVAVFTKTKPDLVLLDINIPGGSGFSVAEKIQTLSRKPIPIVFITASKQPEFIERARELGASGFIEKPYEPAQVLTLLETVLNLAVR